MGSFVLFLDDGGVMSDNAVRGPQWQRLVGEYFAPILGGEQEAWAEANRTVITTILEPSNWRSRLRAARDYADFLRCYRLDWLEFMCRTVGVAMPEDDEALDLVERVERWIRPQVNAAIPGAAEAVSLLHATGYRLFTASGESSEDLDDYLGTMQIRECFECLFGPDLVKSFKDGPEFYEQIFAAAGVAPEDALVVDDSPMALGWASAVGARTVLVGHGGIPCDATLRVQTLRELWNLLATS